MLVSPQHIPLIESIFTFFAAQYQDSKEFERILGIVAPRRDSYFLHVNPKSLSLEDFMHWYLETSPNRTKGLSLERAKNIINRLIDIDILYVDAALSLSYASPFYHFNYFDGGICKNRNLLFCKFFGFSYAASLYKESVFKVVTYDAYGDQSIGTGLLIYHQGRSKILTNYHVIENPKRTKVFTFDDRELDFDPLVKLDENRDLALITLKEDKTGVPHFEVWTGVGILDQVLTIGYPPVASSRNSHPLYHLGEVNSEIEMYSNMELFLFSAKSNPGNSGSPVIGSDGRLLGIVTQILEHKGGILEGKLPYYAAIPSVAINEFLEVKTLVLKDRVVTVPIGDVDKYRHLAINVMQ